MCIKGGKEKLVIKTPDGEISTTLSARKIAKERKKCTSGWLGVCEVPRGMRRLKRFCVTFKQPTAEIKFQLETEREKKFSIIMSFPLSECIYSGSVAVVTVHEKKRELCRKALTAEVEMETIKCNIM